MIRWRHHVDDVFFAHALKLHRPQDVVLAKHLPVTVADVSGMFERNEMLKAQNITNHVHRFFKVDNPGLPLQ
jgi:hypothetical protein